MLAKVHAVSRTVRARNVPFLRGLLIDHVMILGDRVAMEEVEDVALSHPTINVADVLAQLTLMGIERSMAPEAAKTADRFRRACIAAQGAPSVGMTAFEATSFSLIA